jgi:hypothetical protein
VREIELTRGFVALVDDEDFGALSGQKWTASVRPGRIYAQTRSVLMHRLILGNPAGDVDHRNGNGLDNRRANLRVASRSLNNANSRGRAGTSRFKGVSWCRRDNRWQAGIQQNGQRKALGRFDTEVDAALAYDEAARSLFGEFARLNFPKPGERSARRDTEIGAPTA